MSVGNKVAYRCTTCGHRKFIPGRASELARTIRTGCPECAYITRFKQQGV